MIELEKRYRRLLRILPTPYRAVREEEMVETYLLSMETEDAEDTEFLADYGHPGWAERASVLTLAMRLRWGGGDAPDRYRVWGGAVRLFATFGLLLHAVLAVPELEIRLWVSGVVPWAPKRLAGLTFVGESTESLAVSVAGLLWIPAFVAIIWGARREAQLLAALAFSLVSCLRPCGPGG